MTGKTAIVASGDSVMVFQAAGVDAYVAKDEKEAKELLRSIAKDHQIIFLAEELATPLEEFLKRFEEEAYPIILPIPTGGEDTKLGDKILKDAMERALGVDILFNDNH